MEPRPSLRRSLHRIVDDLPDDDLATARRVLQALRDSGNPVLKAFAEAPFDDEADDDDADGGLTEASRERAAGDVLTHDQLKRELETG